MKNEIRCFTFQLKVALILLLIIPIIKNNLHAVETTQTIDRIGDDGKLYTCKVTGDRKGVQCKHNYLYGPGEDVYPELSISKAMDIQTIYWKYSTSLMVCALDIGERELCSFPGSSSSSGAFVVNYLTQNPASFNPCQLNYKIESTLPRRTIENGKIVYVNRPDNKPIEALDKLNIQYNPDSNYSLSITQNSWMLYPHAPQDENIQKYKIRDTLVISGDPRPTFDSPEQLIHESNETIYIDEWWSIDKFKNLLIKNDCKPDEEVRYSFIRPRETFVFSEHLFTGSDGDLRTNPAIHKYLAMELRMFDVEIADWHRYDGVERNKYYTVSFKNGNGNFIESVILHWTDSLYWWNHALIAIRIISKSISPYDEFNILWDHNYRRPRVITNARVFTKDWEIISSQFERTEHSSRLYFQVGNTNIVCINKNCFRVN